jgi:hypothetical protein
MLLWEELQRGEPEEDLRGKNDLKAGRARPAFKAGDM